MPYVLENGSTAEIAVAGIHAVDLTGFLRLACQGNRTASLHQVLMVQLALPPTCLRVIR
jgi:hypothetical protein